MIVQIIVKQVVNWCLKSIMGVFMEKIIVRILNEIVKRLSPEMKQAIRDGVLKLETAAAATSNPWDDLAIKMLKIVLYME